MTPPGNPREERVLRSGGNHASGAEHNHENSLSAPARGGRARDTPDRGVLSVDEGLVGDDWARRDPAPNARRDLRSRLGRALGVRAATRGCLAPGASGRYNRAVFYEDVLATLQAADVRFVVVGGIAVILHGVPRTTSDLDLVPDLDDANMRRLVEVMTRLGFRPRAPVSVADLAVAERRREWFEEKGMLAFSFHRPGRPLDEVDVLFQSPIEFATLNERADEFKADGLVLRVARPSDLITMKQGTGRAQDESDIDALTRLIEAGRHGR